MVKVMDEKMYIDGRLKAACDIMKETIKKDWDMVNLVDGPEGSGKSKLAFQCAYYCSGHLELDSIAFNAREFKDAIIKAKPYDSVVYDEAYTGLSSRATMSLINRTIVSMLAEIRQKNLFVFVVMPCFFDLDKYVALWRSRALLHVYTGENFERGYFAFYDMDRKKSLFMNGKKFYSYSNPRPNFTGRFTKFDVVDDKLYREKKTKALVSRETKAAAEELAKQLQDELFSRLQTTPESVALPHKVKAAILGIPEQTYFYKLRQWNEKVD